MLESSTRGTVGSPWWSFFSCFCENDLRVDWGQAWPPGTPFAKPESGGVAVTILWVSRFVGCDHRQWNRDAALCQTIWVTLKPSFGASETVLLRQCPWGIKMLAWCRSPAAQKFNSNYWLHRCNFGHWAMQRPAETSEGCLLLTLSEEAPMGLTRAPAPPLSMPGQL